MTPAELIPTTYGTTSVAHKTTPEALDTIAAAAEITSDYQHAALASLTAMEISQPPELKLPKADPPSDTQSPAAVRTEQNLIEKPPSQTASPELHGRISEAPSKTGHGVACATAEDETALQVLLTAYSLE